MQLFIYLFVHIVTCIYIIKIAYVLLDFTKELKKSLKTYIQGVFSICSESMWFLVLNEKGAPPRLHLN